MEEQSQGRYSTLEIRTRAIEAVGRGLAVGEIANAYGIDRTTLFRWLTKFGEHGQAGLQRKEGSGRPRLLGILDKNALWQIVLKPATSFGYETDLWTVGRLHRVIEEKYQTKISQDTIWRRLRDAGLTYQKPERQYFQMDEEAREQWMCSEAPKIRRAVKKYRALLYFQDEANVSLTAFLGRDVVALWTYPTTTSDGQEGRGCGDFRHQWLGKVDFPTSRKTNMF